MSKTHILGGTAHSSTSTQTHQPCPLCGSSDAAALYDDGHGYCFSCNRIFNTDLTPRQEAPTPFTDRHHQQQQKEATAPKGAFLPHQSHPDLPKRKLSSDILKRYNYGIGTYKGHKVHIADYHNDKGELIAQHIRGADKSFSWIGGVKANNLPLFGQHRFKGGGEIVTVTEGELDCLSLAQALGKDWPVVSLPNGVTSAESAFKANIEFLESFAKVNICFDNDEAGRAAAEKAALTLSPGKAHIITLPLKDASDMLQADRSAELVNCFWRAAPYRPDGVISGDSLWSELITPPAPSVPLPYPKLDIMLDGIRKRELWLFTAGSGLGKSTLVHELGYHLLNQGHRLGILALEESKKRTALRYLSLHMNTPLHTLKGPLPLGQMKQAFDATIGKEGQFYIYDHFGSTDIDTLLAKIRFLAVGCGVDFLILDHISIVVSGLTDTGSGGERKQIDILMTKLRSLVEETGLGVLAISHLKRAGGLENWHKGTVPSLSDLRGSGGLEQLSDCVIALSRDQSAEQTKDTLKLHVLKNRYNGIVGEADTLHYSHTTGRLGHEVEIPF